MRQWIPFGLVAATLAGCGRQAPPASPSSAAPAITNRISVPAEVVANLGITFEKARRGRLETRLRVPGRVEIAPEARFHVRAPAAGRVVPRTTRWQRVSQGDVLAELLSPDLRAAQEEIAAAQAQLGQADIDLIRLRAESGPLPALAEATERALTAARDRVGGAEMAYAAAQELEKAAGARVAQTERAVSASELPSGTGFAARKEHVEAQAAALEAARRRDEARAAVPELEVKSKGARARAETSAAEMAILEGRKRVLAAGVRQRLRSLAVMTDLSVEALEVGGAESPAWLALDAIPLRAPSSGVVVEVSVSTGEWVEAGATLVRVVDPGKVIFRGEVPEADAARIPAGAEAHIEIACAGCPPIEAKLDTPLTLADPRTRTVALEMRLPATDVQLPDGASATAAVLLSRSASEEVLLPAATIVQDELETIVFRRDPANPAQVIRTPISVGRRSEGWVEVLSEVGEGDEVVRDGVHQLKLTGIGKAPATGHFHADGTWHEGKD